jgi:hypothetical protein
VTATTTEADDTMYGPNAKPVGQSTHVHALSPVGLFFIIGPCVGINVDSHEKTRSIKR